MKSRFPAHAFTRKLIADNQKLISSIGGEITHYGDDALELNKIYTSGENVDHWDGDGVATFPVQYAFMLDLHAHNEMACLTLQAKCIYTNATTDQIEEGIPLLCDIEESLAKFRKIAKGWAMKADEIAAGIECLQKIHADLHKIDVLYLGHLQDENVFEKAVYFDGLRIVSGM